MLPVRWDDDHDFDDLTAYLAMLARSIPVTVVDASPEHDLYVMRRPPEVRRFLEQRVRQAYDDFAQPARLVRELALMPLAIAAVASGRSRALLWASLGIIAIAERGRRRAGGAAVFPRTAALWAPLWVAERAVTVWLAGVLRLRGGVKYRDMRLVRAAASVSRLRKEA